MNFVILWEGDSDRKTKNEKVYPTQPDFTAKFWNSRLERQPLLQTKTTMTPTSFLLFCKSLVSMFSPFLFSAVCIQSNPLMKWKKDARQKDMFYYFIVIGLNARLWLVVEKDTILLTKNDQIRAKSIKHYGTRFRVEK